MPFPPLPSRTRTLFRFALLLWLPSALALPSPAQSSLAAALQRDVQTLSSAPTVAAWQAAHPESQLRPARYTDIESYDVDFRRLDRWCAASVSHAFPGATRVAFFDVPSASHPLPPLPPAPDRRLVQTCRMQRLSYVLPASVSTSAIAAELSAAWGQPKPKPAEVDVPGSGFWKLAANWRRAHINVWLATDPNGVPGGPPGPRVVIVARRDSPPDSDTGLYLLRPAVLDRFIAAAAQIAAIDPGITAAILSRSRCGLETPKPEPEARSIHLLKAWLAASSALPPARQAAAFLVADAYLACTPFSPKLAAAAHTGVRWLGPGDKTYARTYRVRAETLDPNGPAGELAALLALTSPCELPGHDNWPGLAIARAEQALRRFPSGPWTPWLHYAAARAHAARLSFSYPGTPPEDTYYDASLTQAARNRERAAAIDQFKLFLQNPPDPVEAALAWQQAWRLLAGLPPTQVKFACID